MALDDYLEPEVGAAVAVTAALLSPPVRRTLRRGVVYGLAGLLLAREAVASATARVGRNLQVTTAAATPALQDIFDQGQPTGTEADAARSAGSAPAAGTAQPLCLSTASGPLR